MRENPIQTSNELVHSQTFESTRNWNNAKRRQPQNALENNHTSIQPNASWPNAEKRAVSGFEFVRISEDFTLIFKTKMGDENFIVADTLKLLGEAFFSF